MIHTNTHNTAQAISHGSVSLVFSFCLWDSVITDSCHSHLHTITLTCCAVGCLLDFSILSQTASLSSVSITPISHLIHSFVTDASFNMVQNLLLMYCHTEVSPCVLSLVTHRSRGDRRVHRSPGMSGVVWMPIPLHLNMTYSPGLSGGQFRKGHLVLVLEA